MLTHKGVILTIDGEVKITWVRDAMMKCGCRRLLSFRNSWDWLAKMVHYIRSRMTV